MKILLQANICPRPGLKQEIVDRFGGTVVLETTVEVATKNSYGDLYWIPDLNDEAVIGFVLGYQAGIDNHVKSTKP